MEKNFTVDGISFSTEKMYLSGAEIKELCHLEPYLSLFIEMGENQHDRPVKDTDSVKIEDGIKLFTAPRGVVGG